MTATTASITGTTSTTKGLWKTGAIAAATGAVAATLVAAAALAADVPLEIDGEQIPVAGFTQLAFGFSMLGVAIAAVLRRKARNPQRTFTITAVALTALSLVPDLTISGATTATRLTLMATHLVTAAIVIPAVRGRLSEQGQR